jgi:hypothetical protein
MVLGSFECSCVGGYNGDLCEIEPAPISVDIACPRIHPSVGCLPTGLCEYPIAPSGSVLGQINSTLSNPCPGYSEVIDGGCYYIATTTRTYIAHGIDVDQIRRVQLCDIQLDDQLACIGTYQEPGSWTREACSSFFPELYETPDMDGCVDLDPEVWPAYVPNPNVAPCGMATVSVPTEASDLAPDPYAAEEFGTLRIWYVPQ